MTPPRGAPRRGTGSGGRGTGRGGAPRGGGRAGGRRVRREWRGAAEGARRGGHDRTDPTRGSRASSEAIRSRDDGPCSSCSPWGAARCDRSCWPRTRIPHRSWTASRSSPPACGSRSRPCPAIASTPRPGPRRRRGSWRWPDPWSRCRSRICAPRSRQGAAPFLLVAAGITDPRNLGALLRSAECAGVTGVVLPRHRSARLSPTVAKTAAGAIEHLAFAVVGGIPAALSQMSDLGVWSVGLAGESPQSLYDLPLGRGPGRAGGGERGEGPGSLGAAPLRRRRLHPATWLAALTERRGGGRRRRLRGGAAACPGRALTEVRGVPSRTVTLGLSWETCRRKNHLTSCPPSRTKSCGCSIARIPSGPTTRG